MNTQQENDGESGSDEEVLLNEAAEWLIRLGEAHFAPDDPYADPELRKREFFNWIRQSEKHLRAFLEMLDLECRIRNLRVHPVVEMGALTNLPFISSTANSAEAADHPEPVVSLRTNLPSARRLVQFAVIAFGVLTVAYTGVRFLTARSAPIERTNYVTDVGQQQLVTLSDGTTMLLNTGTAVDVSISKGARSVYLNRGETFLSVTRDPQRVFTVYTDDAYVKVLGTELDAQKSPDGLKVAVTSGTVEAGAKSNQDAPASRTIQTTNGAPTADANGTQILSAGQTATISSGRVHLTGINVDAALAWRDGRLVFTETPLAQVAEEFNRYNKTQMRIEGTAAKETLVTGGYPTNGFEDILTFARSKSYLSVIQDGHDWVIKSKQ